MKKFVEVSIEEHLTRTIKVQVPENLSELDRIEYATDKVREMYYEKEEIVLNADDYNGTTLCQIHDIETDNYTDWTNL